MKKRLFALMVVFNTGCMVTPVEHDSTPLYVPVDVMAVTDAIPKYEKRTRAGNPDEYEVFGKRYKVLAESEGYKARGMASWYGTKFHGRKTSNGEVYDMYAMTAAHKTLPIPSYVRVTHLKNQRSVVLRINDRGPFHDNRIIDLSYTAAVKLGIQQTGTGLVEVETLGFDSAEISKQKNTESSEQKQQAVFYLQVGAFSSPGSATQLQSELSSSEIQPSRIQRAQSQGNELYKVQVGPFYSEQQVKQKSERLAQLGFSNTLLIVEKN